MCVCLHMPVDVLVWMMVSRTLISGCCNIVLLLLSLLLLLLTVSRRVRLVECFASRFPCMCLW